MHRNRCFRSLQTNYISKCHLRATRDQIRFTSPMKKMVIWRWATSTWPAKPGSSTWLTSHRKACSWSTQRCLFWHSAPFSLINKTSSVLWKSTMASWRTTQLMTIGKSLARCRSFSRGQWSQRCKHPKTRTTCMSLKANGVLKTTCISVGSMSALSYFQSGRYFMSICESGQLVILASFWSIKTVFFL